MTFSIVAYDPDEQAWGVAVASKFLAVGAVVPWCSADAGAVATQSFAKIGFGPVGLQLMRAGYSAQEALTAMLAADDLREQRQVGIVDMDGGAATHTGNKCYDWAGGRAGMGYAVQGNILAGEQVVDAMEQAYKSAKGELSARLYAALKAGDDAGGDKRGKQSAAIVVVSEGGGYGGDNDRYLDLRVDDHREPVERLHELLKAHHVFFGMAHPEDRIAINPEIARELQRMMVDEGYYKGNVDGDWGEKSIDSFWALVGSENLEERWNKDDEPNRIDTVALEYLRGLFKK